jgi:hypothetical protein
MIIRAHEHRNIRVDHVGLTSAPVVVIDNFVATPELLVDHATSITSSFAVRSKFYPGIRASAPAAYVDALQSMLGTAVRDTFGWQLGFDVLEANYSLVTTPAHALVPFQRIPHIDGVDPDILAVLHYLCSPEQGGTSFYRHRQSGIEVLTSESVERYMRTVNGEVRASGMPSAKFVDGDTPLFERTARYEAQFNRALIYSGSILHSGNIPQDFAPDANPRTGRLTLNTFIKRRREQ